MELGLENRSPLRDAHSANRLPQFVQAVFVDRDGTMGGTGRFIHPRDFDVYPFTREALANLRNEGFLLFALTNQYRISRGEATEEDFHREFEDLRWTGPTFALTISTFHVTARSRPPACCCARRRNTVWTSPGVW